MDSLHYDYYAGTNRLRRIRDSVPANGYNDPEGRIVDIDGQPDNNYEYDAIGNLIKDSAEKISSIKWNVYGKIQEINRTPTTELPASNIKYSYDAMGNRISQEVTSEGTKYYTWYVRDAQGNIMSTYKSEGNASDLEDLTLKQSEKYLYGSSRLGLITVDDNGVDGGPGAMQYYYEYKNYERGYKQYELTNHLGNVLATVSDRKFGVTSGSSSLISYYKPHIVTAQDYYPFGMLSRVALPNSGVPYKFGFNGKMNDNEVKGIGNQQDYGMRIYDPRLGRFLSVDPLTKLYPWLSVYQYAENSPVVNIDLDGLEASYAADGRVVNGPWVRDPVTGGSLYSAPPPNTFAYVIDQSKKAIQKPAAQPKLVTQDVLKTPAQVRDVAIKAKGSLNITAIEDHLKKYGYDVRIPMIGKLPPQSKVDKPRPNDGYSDFEYGMITNPATQAAATTVCPGCGIVYGGAQVYSGTQTGNYAEVGSGLLNMIGGGMGMYGGALAKQNLVKIITIEDDVMEFSAKIGNETVQGITNFSIKDGKLYLNELHLQGSTAGNVGREALWKMAKDLGKQHNVEEVIIQGGKRTTGKYKGKVPSPITIKVN